MHDSFFFIKYHFTFYYSYNLIILVAVIVSIEYKCICRDVLFKNYTI